jgi:hypothetical protein
LRKEGKMADKFPKFFSIGWYFFVVLVACGLVVFNWGDVFGSNPTDVDKALLYFLGAVLLVPLFKKIKFGNIEVEQLRTEAQRLEDKAARLKDEAVEMQGTVARLEERLKVLESD